MSENEAAEGEKRWPEVMVLRAPESRRPWIVADGTRTGRDQETETYVPVSSPRCLSKEEARLLATYASTRNDAAGLILFRLSDWAGEGTES